MFHSFISMHVFIYQFPLKQQIGYYSGLFESPFSILTRIVTETLINTEETVSGSPQIETTFSPLLSHIRVASFNEFMDYPKIASSWRSPAKIMRSNFQVTLPGSKLVFPLKRILIWRHGNF